MRTLTLISILAVLTFSSNASQGQETQDQPLNHSIVGSPFSLMSKLRYERITQSHLTYGARFEFFVGPSIGVLPNGRLYFFSKEASGLYTEAACGFVKYPTGPDAPGYESDDFYPWSIQARVGIGAQFFAGKNNNIPIDLSLSINMDAWYLAWSSELSDELGDEGELAAGLAGIAGPWSFLKFRFQTGFGW
jgi:hypothetical protein